MNQKRAPKKKTVPVFRHLLNAISRSKKQETVRTFFGVAIPLKTLNSRSEKKNILEETEVVGLFYSWFGFPAASEHFGLKRKF
jgi:hypothetical protein